MLGRHHHPRIALVVGAAVLLGGAALVAIPNVSGAATTRTGALPAAAKVGGKAGDSATITGWQIHDSQGVSDSGPTISQPGYAAGGWYAVAPRSTVMAGLLQNGKYPDIFTSTNMKNVDASQFKRNWWYRGTFTAAGSSSLHTVLHLAGVIPRADVWLDGKQIATKTQVAGAHNATDIDITGTVKDGANAIALSIPPADPNKDLITGWIDWNPAPPDHNMGLWQDATLHQSGAVALSDARVTSKLALPGLASADVTAKVDVHNNTSAATTATVAGTVAGSAVSQQVSLTSGQTKTATFTVHLTNPKVWWPVPMGDHPTYQASLTATVGGAASDTASATFGIRDVKSSLDGSGHRVFTINGKPLLIRSGGWAPDMFLRTDTARLRDQFDMIKGMGLNSIRLEGKLETDEFYDLADQYGIMLLPGWECCDKWQSISGWSDSDYQTAAQSMSAVAERIRNHPSVIAFLIGSDEAPAAKAETGYLGALKAAEWPDPVVSSAADASSPQTGKSGMKMDGPYDYVPPNYWYGSQLGAAFGFASELSAGPNVPEIDSLKAMLSTSEQSQLWQSPGTAQYHAGLNNFANLKLYDTAIQNRYGKPTSLDDYVKKAQLTNYENTRAEFEANSARMDRSSNPATGVVYWMLNNGWPSLIWHLYDNYLAPNGGTFGVTKANEPVHVLWQYDSGAVTLVNHTGATASGLSVTAETYSLDGTKRFSKTVTGQSVASLKTTAVTTIPKPTGFTGAYLVKLVVKDSGGKEVDRNVYWWSTKTDTLNWGASQWYYTPQNQFADLSGITKMAAATVSATASTTTSGATSTTTVKLTNTGTGPVPAFFVEATLRDANGAEVTPVSWSDNDVSLWPGESVTLTATSHSGGQPLRVDVAGVNVAKKTATAK